MKSITELAKAVGYPMLVFMGQPYVSPELKRLIEAAVAQEREACAGLCDRFANRMMSAEECADAIRARSNT